MLRSTNSNTNSSSDLLAWPVASSKNDSSSDDDSFAGTYQSQQHQLQKDTVYDNNDVTTLSTLPTEYVLHSSDSSNLNQKQLGHEEVGNACTIQKSHKRKQNQLSEPFEDYNLSYDPVLSPAQIPVMNPLSSHQRLPPSVLLLNTKQALSDLSPPINTASPPPSSPSEYSAYSTVNTYNNSPQLSKALTYSTIIDFEPHSPIEQKHSPVWFSSNYPDLDSKEPSFSVSLSNSVTLDLPNPVKNTIVNSRSFSISSIKSTPAKPTHSLTFTKPVNKKRVSSLPSQQPLKHKSQHSHSSSGSSTYSEHTNTGSEFSNLTNLVTSVPALKLKSTPSPSVNQIANSNTNLYNSLNRLPKYSGDNKPLFEKPLPITPTSSVRSVYPLTPPETINNLFGQPQVITSLVTPVAPIPTRPLSLSLAYKTNSSGDKVIDLSKYNNRYSCSEIMMMEEHLKQMKTCNTEDFPPTPTELINSSSFSSATGPAKFNPSRQPVLSPDSPNNGVSLQSVTKIGNHKSSSITNNNNTDDNNCSRTSNTSVSEQKKPEKTSLVTTPKRFSFLWRKRKSKTATSEEAIEVVQSNIGTSVATENDLDTHNTATTAAATTSLTTTTESHQNTQSPIDDKYLDYGSPNTIVPAPQKQQQQNFDSPGTALLISSSDSVLPIKPRSQLDDKSVRKSLSYELDDEVEKRASQEAIVSVSNYNSFLFVCFSFLLVSLFKR